MERTAVNPWGWSVSMGFNQGEVVTGETRTLFCAGQTSVDVDGAPQHAGDSAFPPRPSVLVRAGLSSFV